MPAHVLAHLGGPDFIASLTPAERAVLPWLSKLWMRPEQRLSSLGMQWRILGLDGGRGFGKSFAVAVEINRRVLAGADSHVGLAAPTDDRVDEVQIKSLIDYAPPWNRPERYRGGLRWPNGVLAIAFTPEAPDRGRGENMSLLWCTEIVAWPRRTRKEFFDNLATATRVPPHPQIIWDSTNKGRNDVLSSLYALHAADPATYPIIPGTMFDNPLLSISYLRSEYQRYAPHPVRCREEIWGEHFDEAEGALWQQAWLDDHRVDAAPDLDPATRMVAVDPATSTDSSADDTGITAGALGRDGHAYATADRTGKHPPEVWGDIVVVDLLERRGGRVTIERKHIGDMASAIIRSRAAVAGLSVRVLERGEAWPAHDPHVIHIREQNSQEAKEDRAAAPAVETFRGRVHLVGEFPELEKELTTWVPGASRSPNRLDAFAYLVSELLDLNRDKVDRTEETRAALVAHAQLRRTAPSAETLRREGPAARPSIVTFARARSPRRL